MIAAVCLLILALARPQFGSRLELAPAAKASRSWLRSIRPSA